MFKLFDTPNPPTAGLSAIKGHPAWSTAWSTVCMWWIFSSLAASQKNFVETFDVASRTCKASFLLCSASQGHVRKAFVRLQEGKGKNTCAAQFWAGWAASHGLPDWRCSKGWCEKKRPVAVAEFIKSARPSSSELNIQHLRSSNARSY